MARAVKKELSAEEKLAAALVPEKEQPYKVPENWCWAYLGNVAEIIMGQSPKGTSTTDDDSYMPLIGGASDMGTLYPKASRYTTMPTKVSHVDDIIICIRATLGKPIFSDGEYCLGRGVTAIRTGIQSKEFLRFCFMNFEQYFYDNAAGTTFAQVTSSTLSKMPIPFPPLPEQQRIVNFIESLFADLDEAKKKLTTIIEGFAQRKAAILHRAFTGELTEKWREENNVTKDSWEDVCIEDIATVKGGKRIPKGMSLVYENTGHPYIKAGNLKYGTVLQDNIMYVPNDVLQYIRQYTVKLGDVYITNVGACIGDCGVIPPEFDGANLTENAVKLTELKCDSNFLSKYISSDIVQNDIKNRIASATLGKLSIANIKKIEVNLPSLSEQKEIVHILDEIFAKEQQAQSVVESVLADIELLKKSILARAFRGELGTGNPEDERAEELLKRVL